ncbi:beta-ketoacyl-ACP synthase III [Planctomycetes bacterium Pan216]
MSRTRTRTMDGASRRIGRTTSLTGFQIIGTGSYVPDQVVTNEELEQRLGFDSDWIVQRTGIRERRHAPEGIATSDLCYEASRRCIESAGVDPGDIDLLVVGTFTPDMSFPSTGCLLQDRLGLYCGAFDVQAACAGFLYALVVGAQFVKSGNSKLCLVVGGDTNSRVINPDDMKTYPLFGDGAGAVLLSAGGDDQGFLSYHIAADGSGSDLLSRPACGSRMPPTPEALEQAKHFLQMDGRAVFKWACNTVTESTQEVLEHAGLTADDVNLFVPHQANVRIINAVGDVIGFPRERVFNNLWRYGNTSAGSIPIALDEARRQALISHGDSILVSGFGAGLTWASAVIRW